MRATRGTNTWAATVAAAALLLTGLGAVTAAPASAAPAAAGPQDRSCRIVVTARETVNVHVTDDGDPPDDNVSPAPPKNGTERDRDRIVGVLAKGRKACLTDVGPGREGRSYTVGGACTPTGKNRFWDAIRFQGQEGYVPSPCVRRSLR
ncbi:hypothetical protein [Pseudonocardia sp.]|uniref:hypothetical protein n=1 Tax=Pseudonocardia sp. TaxID=60912 RepID=UPI003D0B9061